MLFVVDLPAGRVLFAVDLLLLLAGQLATVGGGVVGALLVDVRLCALGFGGFAGGHLTAAQAVGDALILIGFTRVGVVVFAGAAVGSRYRLRRRVLLRHLMISVHVGGRRSSGGAVVHGSQLRTVLRSEVGMLHLVRGRLNVLLVGSAQFR